MKRLGHRFFNHHHAAAHCIRLAAKETPGDCWEADEILVRIENRACTLARALNLGYRATESEAKETEPNAFWRFFKGPSEEETRLQVTLRDSADHFYEQTRRDILELYRLSPDTASELTGVMERHARAHLMAGNAITGVLSQAVILPVAFGIVFDRLMGAGSFGLGCVIGFLPFCAVGFSNAMFLTEKKIPIDAEGIEYKLKHDDTPPAFRAYYTLLKPFSPLAHTLLVALSPAYRGIRHVLHDAHSAADDAEKETRQRELAATPLLNTEEIESHIREIWRSGGGRRF
ncbi:MAG: hypothetical protein J0L97_09250 [Alphaproteobacteria bacterium]|nr:hypothetical protein [Alphaproteobacteria bacterium]